MCYCWYSHLYACMWLRCDKDIEQENAVHRRYSRHHNKDIYVDQDLHLDVDPTGFLSYASSVEIGLYIFVISVVAIFDPVAAKAETADEGHWWRDSDSDSNWWRLRWKDDRALENWDTSIA